MSRGSSRALRAFGALAVLLAAVAAPAAAQQTGTLQGIVVEATTNRPLAGAQVHIPGRSLGTISNAQGRFQIVNVPAGAHTVRVQMIGYTEASREVTVTAGQTTTANFTLEQSAIALQEIVVTGVSGGAMERAKVPFNVARVTADQMPVQAVNPLSQLQGRVPGANIAAVSGRPGQAPQVILRGPTSINASGRSQEPLYVVDGVVLGSSIADINPADIESVEVVKGAAASTLYGSRAASGVIAITTRKGSTSLDGVRFSARSEIGFNDIERDFGIATNHPLLMDETGTRFCVLDPMGSNNVCSRTIDWQAESKRINNAGGDFALATVSFPMDPGSGASGAMLQRTFIAGNWPGVRYNAVQQLVDPKPLTLNDFSMSGRVGETNFFTSVGHSKQGGAIAGLKGYERLNGRINLGHRIGDQWSFDVNSYISRSQQDGSNQEEGGTGFFRLTRVPGVADILQRDDQGRLFIRTNLLSAGVQNENPLYSFENIAREDLRVRYMAGARVRYTPLAWLEADGDFNIDRLNLNFRQFHNKGFRTTNSAPATNEGLIFNGVSNTQSVNTSTGLLLRPSLADWVNSRFTLRWLYEQQNFDNRQLQGNRLRVTDVWDARNATVMQSMSSVVEETRQMSVSAGSFFDVLDRYTFDFALRHDGNSRFGEDNRWQTYGRASAAWLMAREAWFPSDVMSGFTLRASYGTAGNVPRYSAQYETYTIGTGGTLTAQTLGNPNLRPEVVTEVETSLEMELLNRYGLTVTYANSLAKDQILPVDIPVTSGFPRQWQNVGSLRNKTWEAALTLPVVERGSFSWTTRANYTHNRAVVEKLDVPPFFIGTDLQGTDNFIRVAEGERFGQIYGRKFMTECSQLPANFQSQCGGATSAYQKNNEGYLVWVGEGNNPGMGITHNLWNAILPAGQAPWGVQVAWGMPMLVREESGTPAVVALGSVLPDYRLGMSHTVQYKGLSLYGLVEGAFGRSVWNQGKHWAHLDFLSKDLDQGGKSVEDAKPIGYYYRAGPGPAGHGSGLGGFYDILAPNSHMVEDASFVKLRELSASYHVGKLSGFGDWTVSVVGRNLKTWSDYSGFDPEVGIASSGGASGSGLLNAIDAFTFPQLRTVSFVLSTTF
ncbi:MAG TPA: SusC/RagA family TonB-linked outer membrane protein [Longimicrobiaceae bacterium]|nr:SusC/RagA family TonB-linked outer membrane protein [Longimicrobiaceae bacterium]